MADVKKRKIDEETKGCEEAKSEYKYGFFIDKDDYNIIASSIAHLLKVGNERKSDDDATKFIDTWMKAWIAVFKRLHLADSEGISHSITEFECIELISNAESTEEVYEELLKLDSSGRECRELKNIVSAGTGDWYNFANQLISPYRLSCTLKDDQVFISLDNSDGDLGISKSSTPTPSLHKKKKKKTSPREVVCEILHAIAALFDWGDSANADWYKF